MKKILLLLLLTIGIVAPSMAAKKPDWVKKRPVDNLSYTGIGFASKKDDPEYMQTAKQQALNDLASEIKIEIQSESLMKTVDANSEVASYLSNSIRTTTKEDLEQFQLTDTWEDKKEYWVYYKLSKLDYMNYIDKRIAKVVNEGYSFWTKGNDALSKGDLSTAVEMYSQGLDAIQAYANEELKCDHEGETINLSVELYNSLNNVFSGLTLITSTDAVEMEMMGGESEAIIVEVAKENTPLKNVKINVKFTSGSGQLSANRVTDLNGQLEFYIKSITSKAAHQEILVSLDTRQFFASKSKLAESISSVFFNNPPQATIKINLVEVAPKKAFIRATGDSDGALAKSVRGVLANNYFTVVNDPSEANLLITLNCDSKRGEIVKGEMYDFREYFTTVEIEVIDTESSETLLNYTISNHRSLAPVKNSATTAENAAIKDVSRRLKKEFTKQLGSISINK